MNNAEELETFESPAGFQYMDETSFATATYASPMEVARLPTPISKKLAAVVP